MTEPVQPAQPQFEAYTPAFQPPQPEAVAPAPVAPKPKKTGVVVLAIVAVLLLGAAGAFGALYFVEKGHSTDLSKQVEGKDREIADLTKKAKSAEDTATTATDERRKAENEMNSMKACRDAARAVTSAGISADEEKITQAILGMMTKC
ncbi:hypothetical protein [Lentzea flava]|uniref:Uncharacterized protein n=1 Tax=Lentzea flava TaxID=103732 RepID=A0ABQ2VDX0_9PSEU|nr:hypothetical protein [Lentzea flava]MCP2204476.1 hypothetical protein [Lentzea flava]GGU78360.1 hypothetical protein GCM10010178_81750 [Lentzea flava]